MSWLESNTVCARELLRHGYLYLPEVFDPQLITSVADSVTGTYKNLYDASKAGSVARSKGLARGGELAQVVEREGLLRPITDGESLRQVLRLVSESDWIPLTGNPQALRFVPPGYEAFDSRFITPIHQEASAFPSGCSDSWHVLTIWIPLVSCTRSSGTVAFSRGSDASSLKHWRSGVRDLGIAPDRVTEKAWLQDPETFCVFGSDPLREEHRWDVVECRPGDAVIFTEAIAHAGLGNRSSRPRISLDLRFSPADGFIRWDQRPEARVQDFAREVRAALATELRHQSRESVVRREAMLFAFEHLMAEGPDGGLPLSERVSRLISQPNGDMHHGS